MFRSREVLLKQPFFESSETTAKAFKVPHDVDQPLMFILLELIRRPQLCSHLEKSRQKLSPDRTTTAYWWSYWKPIQWTVFVVIAVSKSYLLATGKCSDSCRFRAQLGTFMSGSMVRSDVHGTSSLTLDGIHSTCCIRCSEDSAASRNCASCAGSLMSCCEPRTALWPFHRTGTRSSRS